MVITIRFPSFGCFERVPRPVSTKKNQWSSLAQNGVDLEGNLPTWRLRPGLPTVSLGLKLWIWEGHVSMHGWSRVEPEALGWSNGQNGKERCLSLMLLLVACLSNMAYESFSPLPLGSRGAFGAPSGLPRSLKIRSHVHA